VGRRGDLAPYQWMWVLFVLPFAATAGLAARGFLDFLAGHAPVETPRHRLGWTAATVGGGDARLSRLVGRDVEFEGGRLAWRDFG